MQRLLCVILKLFRGSLLACFVCWFLGVMLLISGFLGVFGKGSGWLFQGFFLG